MFRRTVLVLAPLLAVAGGALAQRPPPPTTHPETRLNFAPNVGGAQFERASSYPIGRETAYSYHYSASRMLITVDVYSGGRRVGPGADSPAVMSQFTEMLQETDRTLRTSGYGNVERPSVPSTCTYGSLSFRCIVYSASASGGRLFSKLLLTGFRDFFVKIKIDWSQGNGQTVSDADKTLQGFIPALMR
jgi:hypothetical protein